MRCCRVAVVAWTLVLLNGTTLVSQVSSKLEEQARREYTAGRFADSERDFRELTKGDPSNLYAFIFLGQSLFRQGKYRESIEPFTRARELELRGRRLSLDQHRILVDQLAMAYGIGGNLKAAHALLAEAVANDPEYPLNYYNMACVYAEEDDKSKVIANLSLAFEHKRNLLKGEQMPDPSKDSSFQKYANDAEFVAIMKQLGYK